MNSRTTSSMRKSKPKCTYAFTQRKVISDKQTKDQKNASETWTDRITQKPTAQKTAIKNQQPRIVLPTSAQLHRPSKFLLIEGHAQNDGKERPDRSQNLTQVNRPVSFWEVPKILHRDSGQRNRQGNVIIAGLERVQLGINPQKYHRRRVFEKQRRVDCDWQFPRLSGQTYFRTITPSHQRYALPQKRLIILIMLF